MRADTANAINACVYVYLYIPVCSHVSCVYACMCCVSVCMPVFSCACSYIPTSLHLYVSAHNYRQEYSLDIICR